MKIQFNENPKVVPVLFISLFFGLLAVVLSVSGYIQVYLLHSAHKTSGIVLDTYLSDALDNRSNSKFVFYSFQADNETIYASETSLKTYSPGEIIPVYYNPNNPKKNGLMPTKKGVLLLGSLITFLSLSGLIHYFKIVQKTQK